MVSNSRHFLIEPRLKLCYGNQTICKVFPRYIGICNTFHTITSATGGAGGILSKYLMKRARWYEIFLRLFCDGRDGTKIIGSI
jgi:hypothetical protein